MYELNTSWILWYHSIKDTTWTKSSYKQFYTFNNLYDYKLFEELIQLNHLQNGMFFLMREGIFPNWEDPDNSEGCIYARSRRLLHHGNGVCQRKAG